MRSTAFIGAAALLFASSSLAVAPSEFKVVVREEGELSRRINDGPRPEPKQPKQPKMPKGPSGGFKDGQAGADLANGIIEIVDWVTKSLAADKDKENKWVGTTVDELMKKNPTKNVLIFHNQASKTQLQGASHNHYELDINFGKTKGYEIFLFDSGVFELSGDGGYLNVGYGGCFNNKPKGNAHVEFAPRTKKCPW